MSSVSTCAQSRKDSVQLSLTSEQFAVFLIEALQDESVQDNLRKSVKIDHEKVADLVTAKLGLQIKHLQTIVQAKDARIKELEVKVAQLEQKADNQEQYSRRTSIRISGIPEEPNEDVSAKVQSIMTSLDINPVVQCSHRVGPRITSSNNQVKEPRPILCQFTGYKDRSVAMNRRKDLKTGAPGVYFSEDLTRTRARLLFLSRRSKKEKKILDAWSSDGKVLIKDNAGRIHHIVTASDLRSFSRPSMDSSASASPGDNNSHPPTAAASS